MFATRIVALRKITEIRNSYQTLLRVSGGSAAIPPVQNMIGRAQVEIGDIEFRAAKVILLRDLFRILFNH